MNDKTAPPTEPTPPPEPSLSPTMFVAVMDALRKSGERARETAAEYAKIAPNSYGAGYAMGRTEAYDAVTATLGRFEGGLPVTDDSHFTDEMIDAGAKVIYERRRATARNLCTWDQLENKEKRGYRECAKEVLEAAEAQI